MKLKELIKNLQAIEENHGGDIDVIYASDDEGNSFHDIYAKPTICKRLSKEGYMEMEEVNTRTKKPNAVIIN